MGWGDYFYYCYYYYCCYYYYNYYLKNPHKTTDKKRRRHTNISQVPMASSAARRVWGGGEHLLDSQPWDGRTDGRRSSCPALEDSEGRNSGQCSLGHTRMLAMEDSSPSQGGCRVRVPGRAPGLPAPGEGGAAASPSRTVPRSVVQPAPGPSRLAPR